MEPFIECIPWTEASPLLRTQLSALSLGTKGHLQSIAENGHPWWAPVITGRPNVTLIVMFKDDTPVAWGAISRLTKRSKTASLHVYVGKKFRRKGIGTRIVRYAMDVAPMKLGRVTELSVLGHDNRSEKFYRSLGWDVVGRRFLI